MAGKSQRGKQAAVAVAALLLLAVIVPPLINANRFRARLAKSVSGSIGRPVTMGNVNIRLLPVPGFEVENFVIADDPAFSAEPLLRAETVVARLRLTSLWRGRLEIARLSFKYPSLNLVRNAEGQWNIEALLRHASQLQTAPTAKKKPETRPRFPYIEADSGRINFKVVQDKKAHVLVDSDFALWLESENQWNMRLEARPTRTDANLGDTGTLRVEGSFVRAEKLEQTPLKLRIELEKSQLGQLTTLIYGRDRGWRGNVAVSAQLQGTPQDFTAFASARIDEFRRYDIASDDFSRITAECTAQLSAKIGIAEDPARNFFDCKLPVGEGNLRFRGYGREWPTAPAYLSITADTVPLATLARVFRHAKRDVPGDVTGGGNFNAYFSRTRYPDAEPIWRGQGSITNANLSSPSLAQTLRGESIHFGFSQVEVAPEGPSSISVESRLQRSKADSTKLAQNILVVDPFPVALGGAKPVTVSGLGSNDGLTWQVKGDVDLGKLFAAGRLLGLQSQDQSVAPQGTASVDLSVRNNWAGFGSPLVTGTAQLRRVKTPFSEVAAPIEIASANLVLTPLELSVQRLSAAVTGTRTQLDGSLAIPRVCDEQPCPVRFDLHASEMNFDDLNRILNPKFHQTNWLGQRSETAKGGSKLFNLDLIGQLSVDRVIMKGLVASNVNAHIAKDNGTVNLTSLRADLLGGRHRGNWRGDFGTSGATYEGKGTIDHASLAQVSALTHDNWGTGSINADFKLALAGTDAATLVKKASGSIDFIWENGSVRRIAAPQFPSGLQFARWAGTVNIDSGAIQWVNSVMDSPSGRYRISGSTTLKRELKLNFVNDKHQILVTGTLERPEVTSQPATPSSSDSASNQQNGTVSISVSTKRK